ncbi:hypothetical protein MAPG_09818 [Magnaporthiopsis poae ATCC 64411]|uniref:Major facilitator superfamily (MFS) profile domain-containing protein n=1 Tax=Magnaporthiopsis poae (strain ATCC 64411 / 73-15) TaxID=644358 RepID=A0A0C4EAY1_MAGP6|nr:hypothetical protein MAPG_09818 [Magnaporthiopsis poae ATCC 64411]
MATMASMFASGTGSGGPGGWTVVVLVFVYTLTYASTWGIVSKIYASEIQPGQTRATATALAQGAQFLSNWLVAFITPIFLAQSTAGPFFLFTGLTVATLVVLVLYMPETRGKSLESIQDAFHPPVKDFVRKHWSGQGFRRRRPGCEPSDREHARISQSVAVELH